MSEQRSQTVSAVQATTTTACSHPEAAGTRWGDPISEERKAELEARLQAWAAETDHGERRGAFDGEDLNGADVYWLVLRTLVGWDDAGLVWRAAEELRRTQDDIALRFSLRLSDLRLDGAKLEGAHLEGAHLHSAHLKGADLTKAHLEHSFHLLADLRHASLAEARLEGAFLFGAELKGASLIRAHLEGTDLCNAHLEGAYLSEAVLDGNTNLEGVTLDDGPSAFLAPFVRFFSHRRLYGPVSLADVRWNDAPITTVYWPALHRLGDEYGFKRRWWWPRREEVEVGATNDAQAGPDATHIDLDDDADRIENEAQTRCRGLCRLLHVALLTCSKLSVTVSNWWTTGLGEAETATRANVQVAQQLRGAGLIDDADRFAYRAQVRQRGVYLHRFRLGRWLFSWVLFLMAGYGYRLGRIFIAYVLIVSVFAAAFLASDVASGQSALSGPSALDALQISLNAIHGRVFFAQFHLDTLQSWLATAESIVGIVVEGVFVAMLIQKFIRR